LHTGGKSLGSEQTNSKSRPVAGTLCLNQDLVAGTFSLHRGLILSVQSSERPRMPAKSATNRRIEAPGGGIRSDCKFDQLCINTIRTLAMGAVQRANSGHPCTPMALAPLVYTIWQNFLRFNSEDPIWPNRDRFVLSNGHAYSARRVPSGHRASQLYSLAPGSSQGH
jgi:hypothetical protein